MAMLYSNLTHNKTELYHNLPIIQLFIWIVVTVYCILAHINHIRSVAGEDHVGIGAGYDGINM